MPFVIYDKNNYNVYLNSRKVELYVNKYSQLQIYKGKNLQNIDVKVKYIVPMKYRVVNIVSAVIVGMNIFFISYISYKNKKHGNR